MTSGDWPSFVEIKISKVVEAHGWPENEFLGNALALMFTIDWA
jgi:hypothetical protein